MERITSFSILSMKMEGFKKFKEPFEVNLDTLTYISGGKARRRLRTQSHTLSAARPFGARRAAIGCKIRSAGK